MPRSASRLGIEQERIHNTLELGELLVSEAYRAEIEQRDDLEIVGEGEDMPFDKNGDLPLQF